MFFCTPTGTLQPAREASILVLEKLNKLTFSTSVASPAEGRSSSFFKQMFGGEIFKLVLYFPFCWFVFLIHYNFVF